MGRGDGGFPRDFIQFFPPPNLLLWKTLQGGGVNFSRPSLYIFDIDDIGSRPREVGG